MFDVKKPKVHELRCRNDDCVFDDGGYMKEAEANEWCLAAQKKLALGMIDSIIAKANDEGAEAAIRKLRDLRPQFQAELEAMGTLKALLSEVGEG